MRALQQLPVRALKRAAETRLVRVPHVREQTAPVAVEAALVKHLRSRHAVPLPHRPIRVLIRHTAKRHSLRRTPHHRVVSLDQRAVVARCHGRWRFVHLQIVQVVEKAVSRRRKRQDIRMRSRERSLKQTRLSPTRAPWVRSGFVLVAELRAHVDERR